MKYVPVRDFRVNPASVWSAVEADGRVVVTNHGQPTAVMLKVDADTVTETLAAVDQAEWVTLLTRMQAAAAAGPGAAMSPEDIDAEIAAARAGR